MAYIDFLSTLHKATSRDYIARLTEYPKAKAIETAKEYGYDYWDGDRKFGYGGYSYDGRWRPVAEAMVKHYGLQPGNRILDVGCKGSLFSVLLAGVGFEVWGIDLSDIGRYKSRHPNFRFIKGDVTTAQLPENSFDVITIISTIEHVGLKNDGDIGCLKRLHSLLKDNGQIILTAPYGSPALFERSRIYDRERLARIFEGWKIERMDFFKEVEPGKWIGAEEDEVSKIKHVSDNVHSIVCLMASK